jgi:hypothetical protein
LNSYVILIPLVMKPCLTLLKFICPLMSKKGIHFLLRQPFKKDSDVYNCTYTDPDRSTLNFGRLDLDPDPGGQKILTKK